MKTETYQANESPSAPFTLLNRDQIKLMGALMLIGTGVFFSLAFGGQISWSSPWWVMYIAIPSLVLLFAAGVSLLKSRKATPTVLIDAVVGLIGIILSAILAFDPTWSFTQSWRFDDAFPFLQGIEWNPIWQWAIVIVGVVLLTGAVWRHSIGLGVAGVIVVMTGFTFLVNLSWNSVWPLMIVMVGIGLLVEFGKHKN